MVQKSRSKLMAIIFQIFSILGFTIGNSLWHKPVKKLPITFIIACKSLITSLLFAITLLIALKFEQGLDWDLIKTFDTINLEGILYSFGLCAISFWGLYFFNQSLKHTASAVSITVAGMGTLVGFMIAVFVYHETITPINIASSILGMLGLWCLEKLNSSFFKLKFSKGMLFGLLSMLFWRVGGLFPLAIDKVGILLFSVILELTVCLISSILLISSGKTLQITKSNTLIHAPIILAIALTNFVGILGNHLSLKFTSMVNYTLLSLLAPLVTFSMSLFWYKERYTAIQWLGFFIIIFGGLGLNFLLKSS